MLSFRDKNEGTRRSVEGGGVPATHVTPDPSYERKGAGRSSAKDKRWDGNKSGRPYLQ